MNLSRRQLIIIIGGLIIVLIIGFVIFGNIRRPGTGSGEVALTVWGTESENFLKDVISGYKTLRSNANIEYIEIDEAEYEDRLLNALASGKGPDVFYVKNTSVPRLKNILSPVSAQQFNLIQLQELFPRVTEQNFVLDGQIYALPLYIDTLALIYNRDFFDQAGITSPPKTWTEFQKMVPLLRVSKTGAGIERAAAAIGGSMSSISSGVDMLNLLMLQNGAEMTNGGNTATFASGGPGAAGQNAFNFYLQFANAGSPYHTWNDALGNSIQSFAQGKTAMIFDYRNSFGEIKKVSPFLNFGIAAMPQPDGASIDVNYASYQGLTASRQSKFGGWAWDFIVYATTNKTAAKSYGEATGRPPALRTLVSEKQSDPQLNVFAKQALTARSWRQVDDEKVKEIFDRAIKNVLSGQADSAKALRQAQDQINQIAQ